MGPGKPGWQGHRATPGRRQGNGLADGSLSQNSSRPLHAIRGLREHIQSKPSVRVGATVLRSGVPETGPGSMRKRRETPICRLRTVDVYPMIITELLRKL
jgi:hypothetical protein